MKCLTIEAVANAIHATLNQMIVGSVLTVDVNTRHRLDANANRYSHHHCLPNRRPGKMMAIFVANAHASMALTRVQ